MKKTVEFPRQQDHSVLLSEQLRQVWITILEAESCLEQEMALRDLKRIIELVEWWEMRKGA